MQCTRLRPVGYGRCLPASLRRRPVVSRRPRLLRTVVAKAVDFKPKVFKKEIVNMPGEKEGIVRGGRDKYPSLEKAFQGIKQIGVIGWGSQAPAQAQNLRETFQEMNVDIKVVIGLRPESTSNAEAEVCGFTKEMGTLGETFDVISQSDFVLLLISDAAQVINKNNSCTQKQSTLKDLSVIKNASAHYQEHTLINIPIETKKADAQGYSL